MDAEENIKRLEETISAIYDQLAMLAAQRDAGQPDSELEAQLSRCLRIQQKQEGDLIRATGHRQSSAVEQGLMILRSVEELRKKYDILSAVNDKPCPVNSTPQPSALKDATDATL